MITGHYRDVRAETSPMPGARATIRWLIDKKKGAPNFAMRVIELPKQGDRIPWHSHDYEHEVFVLEGRGKALSAEGTKDVGRGDYVFILPGEEHGFENTGDEPFRFICVIPNPA
ncbi:MAG: cupin domain-containing protein [candidate division WOR-3 bacterium]